MAQKKAFLLRLPPDLWEEINRWSKDDLRSVNAQIEYLLRDAARRRRRTKDDQPDEPARDHGDQE